MDFDYAVIGKFLSVGIRRPPRRGGPTRQARNDGKADFLTYHIIRCYTWQLFLRVVPLRGKFLNAFKIF